MSRKKNIENAKMALCVIEEMQVKLLMCYLTLMGFGILFGVVVFLWRLFT